MEEFKLRKLLEDASFFIKNQQEDETFKEQSKKCLQESDEIIQQNTRESFISLSAEVIITYVEVCLQSQDRDQIAQRILDIFFQRVTQEDQYFIRALLAYSTVEERKIVKNDIKGDDNLKQILLSYSYIKRAIDIIIRAENKQKYQFLIYNTSIKTWHIIRGLMRPGWSKNLIEILEKVSNLLEEFDDFDFNWRCRYLNALVKAMFDGEKKPEALKILDKLWELTKKKGECKFQEQLFRSRIHNYRDNNGILGNIKKEVESNNQDPNQYKSLYIIQSIRSTIIPELQIEKELTTVMSQICPASISMEQQALQQASKIGLLQQDRLAECGRIAIKQNLIVLCENSISVVNRARQGSLRAKIWNEFNKAELILKKPTQDIDEKSGMKLNILQKQIEDFNRRVDAIKLLDRTMMAAKRLNDPDIILEGCILIWNNSIPLLKKSTRHHIYKPFQTAATLLKEINSNENQLRVALHLEIAKFEIDQDFLGRATSQLEQALQIDYSLTLKQLQGIDIKEDEDAGDYQRQYQKITKFLLKKLALKSNLYGGEPQSIHEQIILDIEIAKTSKNQKQRENLVDRALKQLIDYNDQGPDDFEVDQSKNLVEEEIKQLQKQFKIQQLRERKERVLMSNEIAKICFDDCLFSLSFQAATETVKFEIQDIQKNMDLVIAKSESYLILARCIVEKLLEEEIEIGYKELITVEEDQNEREFSNEDRLKYQKQKKDFLENIQFGIKLAQQSQQSWLIFNISMELWNNYLPVFKKFNFQQLILPEALLPMQECFEAMNNTFISAAFNMDNIDYELDKKMQVFSNLSVCLARFNESLNKNDECVRICDVLLQKQLPSHLRKTFDSIKARVTKSVSSLGNQNQKQQQQQKGGKDQQIQQQTVVPTRVEILTSEVLSYLELIQNGNKDLIQKAMEQLNTWQPNQQEEIELELNIELWCRLSRLAQNFNQVKVSLYCAQQGISNADQKYKQKQYVQIPQTRLRWYSVAHSLYGECLQKLVDKQKQEKQSQDQLLLLSVDNLVISCQIGSITGLGFLVLESAKLMWNSLLGLLESQHTRKLIIQPMNLVHTYLKQVNESSDPDFLVLFYSALFTCIQEEKDWKKGETIVEEAFKYIPQVNQKVLWEAKMLFLSKLGKNVLNAISNMKESNQSLMAKVWVKLARSSSNQLEQHNAYNKAIEILRKEESVEIVEILIEYAEWLQRNKYASQDVEDQLQLAVDILMEIDPNMVDDEDEPVDQDGNDEGKSKKTGKSRSSKISRVSKAKTKMTGKSNLKSKIGTQKSHASKRSAAMRSKAGSRISKKTTTALSKRQEEDSQPLFQNCSHYEKLIRILSTLAMISQDTYKQREYTLDAHFFLMKMWEQSYQTLNALIFYDERKQELEEFGFKLGDQESRKQYFYEIFGNSENIEIPTKHNLPEKVEDWYQFQICEDYYKKSQNHEDKIMISKWTFVKPELTFYHLNNLLMLLEDHYLHVQMISTIEFIKLFGNVVLDDKKIQSLMNLKKYRLLMNLGLNDEEIQKYQPIQDQYILTDEEKKVNLEKIKALKDENDNLKDKNVNFNYEDQSDIFLIENIKIHQIWLLYAQELIKHGDFIQSKQLLLEVNLHSRILKDQDIYSQSLIYLSTIAYLEGESASALRLDMLAHQYAKQIRTVEEGIEHTFKLLVSSNKIEECGDLIKQSMEMFQRMRDNQSSMKTLSQNQERNKALNVQNNLPLECAQGTLYLLKAILCIRECREIKGVKEQGDKLEESFKYIDGFENILQKSGYKNSHIIKMLDFAYLLQIESKEQISSDLKKVEIIKLKLEKNAKILLRIQELLTNQIIYIGLHQDSNKNKGLSIPVVRLLGIAKLRIAQINTTIGVIKNNMKLNSATQIDPQKKLDKIVETFMDAVTKQIEAQTNTYKQKMNRYEKSISILYSAKNMVHPSCCEYQEIIVEIAKCRRLLAVNKKHLRGQWRQDAIEVDQINMNKFISENKEQIDRKDQLEQKDLKGEIVDNFVDYKEEALKTFIEIIENSQIYNKILEQVGENNIDNILSNYSLEYAECRGNLNKEQAFFSLVLYQYSINRQQLLKIFEEYSTDKHPDILRLKQIKFIKLAFQYYSTPYLPKQFTKLQEDLKESSKPYKILSSTYQIEDFKENLPHSSAYLSIQLSEDKQYLYYGIMIINKERKVQYYTSKIILSDLMRDDLQQIIETVNQNKTAMQKTPITIQEDLNNLEKDSQVEIQKLMNNLEIFFSTLSESINHFINPTIKVEEEEVQNQQQVKGGGVQKPGDKKQVQQQKAPAKGNPKGGAQDLAAYESNLPLSTGGIEQLILCVDSRLSCLPLEHLQIFSKVPVVSRDFNLHLYLNRVKSVGHQAHLHNNQGIQKEAIKYIFDAPQQLEEQSQKYFTSEIQKLNPQIKVEGIQTKQHHIPSEGEWQRSISQASLFMYFSLTSLVHKFPPSLISDLSIFSKCRAMFILDRMNTFKTQIDRGILTSKYYQPQQQPIQMIALFSLCGITSITTNQWSTKPENNYMMMIEWIKNAFQDGVYVGAALRKWKEKGDNDQSLELYRYNFVNYGMPLLRIV